MIICSRDRIHTRINSFHLSEEEVLTILQRQSEKIERTTRSLKGASWGLMKLTMRAGRSKIEMPRKKRDDKKS